MTGALIEIKFFSSLIRTKWTGKADGGSATKREKMWLGEKKREREETTCD